MKIVPGHSSQRGEVTRGSQREDGSQESWVGRRLALGNQTSHLVFSETSFLHLYNWNSTFKRARLLQGLDKIMYIKVFVKTMDLLKSYFLL